jgi:regulator of protease activity HflC (stomatin/prohibitin superfamily)
MLIPCCLEEVVGKISLRQKELKCLLETKTKDNVFVNITLSVMYMVLQEKIYNAFYDLSNPEQQMTAYVYDCVRAALCDLNLNETFDSKDKIAQTIKSQLTEKVGKYGYMIINALVVDIDPDRKVKDAMNEINAASRAKEAATQRAEGEKMLKVKVAESQMEAQYLSGVGVAKQRKAIMEGLRQNVQGLSSELTGQGATYKVCYKFHYLLLLINSSSKTKISPTI